MRLFLLRHANAKNGTPDETRVLDGEGFDQIENLCGHLNRASFDSLAQIWHSPYARAVQTAECFAKLMGFEVPLITCNNLRPYEDPSEAARSVAALSSFGGDLMIVGHNPHIESIAGLLLGASGRAVRLRFGKSALACLQLEECPCGAGYADYGSWTLDFFVAPDRLA